MLDHRGFSAWITSEDLELVEFEPRVNEKAHIVTCWIAGSVGRTFIVHWRDHGSHVDSASYIHFDGFKVSGQFLYGSGEELRRGVRVSSEEERPFVFSSVEADDPAGFNGKSADKNVGSIVLEIRLIKRVGEREPNTVRPPPDVVRGHRQQGDVCIKYGDLRPAAMQKRTWVIEPFDPKAPGPYVTFVFRYRSKEWLVSQGMIGEDEETSRVLDHPPISTLSKSDLPPVVEVPEQAASVSNATSIQDSPHRLHYASPPPLPTPVSSSVKIEGLGLGPRPHIPSPVDNSRVPSTSSMRSFSGTWDASVNTQGYEEWDEYRPDEFNDAVDNYY